MTPTYRTLTGLTLLALGACGGSAGDTMETPAPAETAQMEMPAEAPAEPAAYFTAEQADRGQTVFRSYCSECHYTNEFTSEDFKYSWRRDTAEDLYEYVVDAMPESAPGSLSSQEYLDVLAYFLELNGLEAGSDELTASSLAGISLADLPGS